ncbi:MAG: hypothetical protein WDM90_03130 [Ferruginibacter sp.]
MSHIVHLSKDKKLQKLLPTETPYTLTKRKNVHLYLCNSIMSQQLSTKVANVFQKRFLGLYDGKSPTAEQIAATPFETLRSIGLSNAKANYVLNVSNFFIQEKITDARLYKMSNEELIKYLTK